MEQLELLSDEGVGLICNLRRVCRIFKKHQLSGADGCLGRTFWRWQLLGEVLVGVAACKYKFSLHGGWMRGVGSMGDFAARMQLNDGGSQNSVQATFLMRSLTF